MPLDAGPGPIWTPSPERVARANLTRFLAGVRRRRPPGWETVSDFAGLFAWSVARPEAFWPEVWRFCEVLSDQRPGRDPWDQVVLGLDRMAPPDPVLGRAVKNVMTALSHRIGREGLDDELLHEIAAILDEAAQKIERTK